MSKITSAFVLTLILFVLFAENAFAANKTLRLPQGRLGTGYKTERYRPLYKTNMTTAELEKVAELIKEQEAVQKKNIKEFNNRITQRKVEQKIQERKQKEQLKNEAKQKLEQQKQEQLAFKKQQKEDAAKKRQEQLAFIKEQKALSEKEKQKQSELLKTQNEKNQRQEKELAIKSQTNKEVNTIAHRNIEALKSLLPFKKNNQEQSEKQVETQSTENISPVVEQPEKTSTTQVANITKNVYQDPQTKAIVTEISTELSNDKQQMLEELSTLWVSAVQKSDTVYFAIMKLSNPNGEEVNKKGVKKILEPIISAAPLIGQAFVNPALTAGSLIGSNVMGTMMNDSASRRLAKVNDADLVILARAIDELQETLLTNYMTYKSALKEYELSIKIAEERKKVYDELNKENSPNVILANTFYTEALDNQYKARQDFLMKRVVLEQMVGSEALNEIEQKKVSLQNAE